MRRELVILPLVLALGCNEIIATGRFEVRDGAVSRDGGGMDGGDGGGMDGGGTDSGVDACASNLWYRDSDSDTYGNPAMTMMGCDQPTGYVANADDCDDSTDTVAPGVTETCDDVDQDCDGAVDEGLIGPIGAPVPIVSDLGFTNASADLVAAADGIVAVWRKDTENVVRATFLRRDGSAVMSDVFVAGGTSGAPVVRSPVVTRMTETGLDSAFIAWLEPDGIYGRICSFDGSCGPSRDLVTGIDGAAAEGLAIAQLGSRLIVHWADAAGLYLRSVDPALSTGSPVVSLPAPVSGGQLGFITVSGATPHVLVGRVAHEAVFPDDGGVPLPDGGIAGFEPAVVELLRVDGEATLAVGTTEEWMYTPRCTGPVCSPLSVFFRGAGSTIGEPSAIAFEAVATLVGGSPVVSVCALPLTPAATGGPAIGSCTTLPSSAAFTFNTSIRGSVATTAIYTGSAYAIRDIPLRPDADGGPLVGLPGLDSLLFLGGPGPISMKDAHGALLADTTASSNLDVVVQRIGCTP